ncbi:MAG: N-acetylglucosamine-6-phosphate deacetylase [Ginsengibacter sp.]
MIHAFLNARVFTGKEMFVDKVLLTKGDKIAGLVEKDKIPSDAIRIDCQNGILAPGLIDLQIYGGGGHLFSNQPTKTALKSMIESLISNGTTGFYLTLATNSIEVFKESIKIVKQNPHPALLGLHFEGPYLNPIKRGAHITEYIKRPTIEEVSSLLEEAAGVLKMVTLAPEMCSPEIIRLFTANGVVVSAGHSNATFEEAVSGFENGITTTTHLFNAMSPFHHRNTGLPGAVFLSETAYASIIADGIHVDYNTLVLSKKLLKERLFLITDAVEEVKEGAYIHVKQNDRFTLPDGTLSGSRLTMLQAVKNCVEKAGISLDESLRMASTYPAKVINRNDLGIIQEGAKANLTIFTPYFEPKFTIVEGVLYETNEK